MHTCMRSHGEEPGCGRKIAALSGAQTSAPAHSSLPQLPFGSEEGNKQAAAQPETNSISNAASPG